MFCKKMILSDGETLSYNEFPVPAESGFPFDECCERAQLENELVTLWPAESITNIVEYLGQRYSCCEIFWELSEILYPDVDKGMYYGSIRGYSDAPSWMTDLVETLSEDGNVFLFNRITGMSISAANIDENTILLIKDHFKNVSCDKLVQIAEAELIDADKYRVEIDGASLPYEETLEEDLSLPEALEWVADNLDHQSILDYITHFSLEESGNEKTQFQIYVCNNSGNRVIECAVTEEADNSTEEINLELSYDILSIEKRYINDHFRSGKIAEMLYLA